MGDGRAEGQSAIGDRGQAAISLTPDVDGTHICIFESSQLESSCVGDLIVMESYCLSVNFFLCGCQKQYMKLRKEQ